MQGSCDEMIIINIFLDPQNIGVGTEVKLPRVSDDDRDSGITRNGGLGGHSEFMQIRQFHFVDFGKPFVHCFLHYSKLYTSCFISVAVCPGLFHIFT